MASITEEFSGECFDFDCLSESRLGGIVLKREQKEAVANLICWSSCLLVSLFSSPLISSASIFNGKLADSVSTAGDVLLMFAFLTSKGLEGDM